MHHERAVAGEGVGDFQFCLHVGHVVFGHYVHTGVAILRLASLGFERSNLHGGIPPHAVSLVDAGTHVVVGNGAPEVRMHVSAVGYHVVAVHLVADEQSVGCVESGIQHSSLDAELRVVILLNNRQSCALGPCLQQWCLEFADGELLVGNGLPFLQERFRFFHLEVHVEHQFTLGLRLERQSERDGFLRLNLKVIERAVLHGFAVGHECPVERYIIHVAEEILVLHGQQVFFLPVLAFSFL